MRPVPGVRRHTPMTQVPRYRHSRRRIPLHRECRSANHEVRVRAVCRGRNRTAASCVRASVVRRSSHDLRTRGACSGSADYVLGPGDELLIRVWGKIDLDSRVTVDRNGQVYLPKLGTLNVAGLRYDQLEGYLHSAVSALFKDFELNVAMGQLRSIQIFVLGCARRPGSYTVGSLSTLVNALFASGGPSATGTMRHIQLRRGNRTLIEFDVYDLAQKGDKSHDVQLLPGDVIYIPHVGAQVAITGSVNEPGIYELKDEMTVAAALEGAGGLTSLAGAQRALLERIENRSARVVEEFPLDTQGMQKPLSDGDLLRIFPLSPKFENAVTLRGNVAQPGRYVWKAGMRVSDLIPSANS